MAIDYFNTRSVNPSRLENFSDAVFAFSITLLMISLEVPTTFSRILDLTDELIAFAITIIPLFIIWQQHRLYFRRYGVDDRKTVIWNTVLLFIVLIFIFPLKFLSLFLIRFLGFVFFNTENIFETMIYGHQVPLLMIYYGVGVLGILFVFYKLYSNALALQKDLKLDTNEIVLTKYYQRLYLHLCAIPLLSIVFVLIFMNINTIFSSVFAGILYGLTGIVFLINKNWLNKTIKGIS